MALITRVARLFTADVHAVLDRIEEPEVVLKQAIREMADEISRGEQRQSWLEAEQQQLEQIAAENAAVIATADGELDLCFEADEEQLARSLVRRKLIAEQRLRQVTTQLDAIVRAREALAESLAQQIQQLADMQQKADALIESPAGPARLIPETGIAQDAIDVAFLKEKRLREQRRSRS